MKSKLLLWIKNGILLIVVIAVALPLLRYGYRRYLESAYPLAYRDIVSSYAEEFDLSESLIYGVIYTESRFDPSAVSSADAKGLMQLMDGTFDWALSKLGEEAGNVFDPQTNIRCGTKILHILQNEFENVETVLAAYNAGIGRVTGWLADSDYSADGKTLHTIPIEETREYVVRVLSAQKMYQTLYEIP